MAGPNIASLLDQLAARFQRLDVSTEQAHRTLQLALRVEEAARKSHQEASRETGSLEGLERCLLALSQALSEWSAKATEALGALLVGPAARPPWVLQFSAGCCIIAGLVSLAKRPGAGIQPSAAFRIATACQLIFEVGRPITAVVAAEVEADAAAGQPPDEVTLGLLSSLASDQLEAVTGCLSLLQPKAVTTVGAAFARSTARPAVMLPWLAEVARAVRSLKDEISAIDSPGPSVARRFASLVVQLAVGTFQEHAAAIAADAALQDAITGALLTSCLPLLAARLAAAAAEGLPPGSHAYVGAVGMLAPAVQRLQLAPAVARHMRRPGAAAIMHHAAAVVAAVAALPADLPDGLAVHWLVQDSLLAMHLNAAELLALCSSGLSQPAAPAGGAGSSGSGGGSGSSSGGGSGGNSSSVDAADLSSEQLALAWELVAAVPHIGSALQAIVAAAPANDASLALQASVVGMYSTAVGHIPIQLGDCPCSTAQLSAWAAAAAASLRLHPLLWQLDAALQPLTDESQLDQSAAGLLAARLRFQLCCRVPTLAEGAQAGSSTTEQPTPAALQRQLLQAHLAGCRLAHWLSQRAAVSGMIELAGSNRGLVDQLPSSLLLLLHNLCLVQQREIDLAAAAAGQRAGMSAAKGQASCLALVPAVKALADLVVAAWPADSSSDSQVSILNGAIMVLSGLLFGAVMMVPDLADPATLAPLETLLPLLPQGEASDRTIAAAVSILANNVAMNNRWGAALASSGLLAAGLDAATRLSSSDQAGDAELVGQTLNDVECCFTALDSAALAALQDDALVSLPEELATQLDAACEELRDVWRYAFMSSPAVRSLADRAGDLQDQLPAISDLAALMQQYYALPAVEEPRRRALAQAAAVRSCAYLRCANVAGEGGPAAGEGSGSKRCSACRAVWYCGTACAHANWREGGHKHVCAALGEVRQAAKEARRAARAAARAAAGPQ